MIISRDQILFHNSLGYFDLFLSIQLPFPLLMNEFLLIPYLLPLFLHLLLPFLLLSICLWACLSREYLCQLLQREVLRLRGPSCPLYVLLRQLLIQLRVSKHLAHVVDSHNLAITAHGFKEELHKLWVLHVVFFLDDKLIVQDVLRCED